MRPGQRARRAQYLKYIINIVYNLPHGHLHNRNGGVVAVHGMRVEVVSEDAGGASNRAKAMSKPRM